MLQWLRVNGLYWEAAMRLKILWPNTGGGKPATKDASGFPLRAMIANANYHLGFGRRWGMEDPPPHGTA